MEATGVLDNAAGLEVGAAQTVGDLLLQAHRDTAACTLRLFDLIGELEVSEAYLPTYPDAASWLMWQLGLAGRTARAYVRVSRALGELPAIRRAFGAGVVSLDHVQVLLRVATADNEGELVELARRCENIEDLGAAITDREDADEEADADPQPEGARVRTSWRNDALHVRASVPGADGVVVEKALHRLAAMAPKDERTGLFREFDVRAGEALVQMASESLADDGDHDRATMVVHIPARDLVTAQGEGWDAARRIFSAGELQRLACDARLQPALHDVGGVTVGVGRTTRKVEPWLRRLVEGRDRGCRFPGCDRNRWLHCHHIIGWSQHGPTNLDNLISLCGFHHRLIHDDGWLIEGDPNRALVFRNKFGRPHAPPPDRFPSSWDATVLKDLDRVADRRLGELAGRAPP